MQEQDYAKHQTFIQKLIFTCYKKYKMVQIYFCV